MNVPPFGRAGDEHNGWRRAGHGFEMLVKACGLSRKRSGPEGKESREVLRRNAGEPGSG